VNEIDVTYCHRCLAAVSVRNGERDLPLIKRWSIEKGWQEFIAINEFANVLNLAEHDRKILATLYPSGEIEIGMRLRDERVR
jgi:hypothetical protein